jgi:hypothetical protein
LPPNPAAAGHGEHLHNAARELEDLLQDSGTRR